MAKTFAVCVNMEGKRWTANETQKKLSARVTIRNAIKMPS